MNELALKPKDSLTVARVAPTALDMIQAVIEKGVTSENVTALRELVALKKDMDAEAAKQSFIKDFISLQAALKKVQATKIIPDRNNNMRSSFAPFEEIDEQVKPICEQFGFIYTFSEGPQAQNKVTKICTLMHRSGHERSNPYSVRIGAGPPGCSESQADGSAHSYAKRGALCDCLNIVVHGIDNDARMEGGTITREQAEELARRVAETNSKKETFLKFAGAKDFFSIPTNRYDILDELLTKKEGRKT